MKVSLRFKVLNYLPLSAARKALSSYHRLSACNVHSCFKVCSIFILFGKVTVPFIKSFEMGVYAILNVTSLTACQKNKHRYNDQSSRHSQGSFWETDASSDTIKKCSPKLLFRYPDLLDFRSNFVPGIVSNIVQLDHRSRGHGKEPGAGQLLFRQRLPCF